ncbi:cation-transporting ATPase [Brachybacterium hainanense]|uniref:Cation-transporting ATPase n=1 Tax=Brachybacterium hainanense TaxID=1541174 RepID=A0ABV6RGI4_9MICO
MSTLNRLVGMAKKALGSAHGASSHGTSSGTGDWRTMVRSAADAITGDGGGSGSTHPGGPTRSAPAARTSSTRGGATLSGEDQRAIARYDYLVRTADPQQLEQVHREAFDRLTPQQRAQVQARMREELPPAEQPRSDASADLARSATRLGAMDPRRLTGLLSRAGRSGTGRSGAGRAAAIGMAGAAGGMLAAVAGSAVLTSIGGSLLASAIGEGIDVDALMPDLQLDLGELGALGDLSANDLADGVSGLGDVSLNDALGTDLGEIDLGDLGGFLGR